MELAAPGVQYLQGDNQLYNGASSNLIDRWISSEAKKFFFKLNN